MDFVTILPTPWVPYVGVLIEADVADGKADHPACYQLGQVFVLQYFGGMADSPCH